MRQEPTVVTSENEPLQGEGEVMASERTGLLVIRTWVEPGSSRPLRAQVRLTRDVSAGFERTLTLARADAVSAVVQEWLADVSCEAELT